MSGHYEDEREQAALCEAKDHSGHGEALRRIPQRLKVCSPDIKANRPAPYRKQRGR